MSPFASRAGLLLVSFCLALGLTYSQAPRFNKLKDGVQVFPDAALSGNCRELRVRVVADDIFRVTALPGNGSNETTSLITVGYHDEAARWKLVASQNTLTISTRKLTAVIALRTGAVQFADREGRLLVAEKAGGRSMQPVSYEGKPLWKVEQHFETTGDDAWYGLGQHQDGKVNYRGAQELLFQNNTEVAIPFLVSRKHYGILWDNNSITLAGDVRPYQPIKGLKLFSREGDEGWLSAQYFNDKNSAQPSISRPESDINYEFLNDLKMRMPAGFLPANGKVVWEGSLATDEPGVHHLRFTYGGYIKVWIGDRLVLDRWREAWNPCIAVIDTPMQQGRKYPFRIEWIPDGGESYISLKYLPPIPAAAENSFGFSSEAGEQCDYYLIAGNNIDGVISGYRKLTGKAAIVPRWAMGLWQSRERYKTEDEVLSTMAEFRRRGIPLDNIVQDWSYWKQAEWGSQEFDPTRFPSPDSMIRVLHDQFHAHFMISVWPKFYEGIPAYTRFNNKGWLYKRNVADRQRDWIAQGYVSTFYDAFNPEARKAFWDLLNEKLFNKGIDGWWMDASEPDILSNVSPEKRKEQMTPTALGPAAEFLNAYPLENARGIYEGQRSVAPNQRVFILTRSAFAGSQHYGAAVWSGDIAARWSDMKNQIAAGINFSMSGIPFWSMDIGGFAVQRRFEHPSAEELEEWREQATRWYQFGCFVPLFRVHGQFPYREIFNTAPETHPAYQSMLFYDKLRYRLMPYIYSLAGWTYVRDYTIMRGLVMDFPQDPEVTNISDEYLFGPSLLVNPVYDYKGRSRKVYLPGGSGWYDLLGGNFLRGGQTIQAEAPYERMPVFVKAGSILPMGPDLQYTDEKPANPVTLFVYQGGNGSFELYEDEGSNYNYEKGRYTIIPFAYNDESKTLTIGKRQGAFSGMLQNRTFNVVVVRPDRPRTLEDQAYDKVLQYNGQPVSVDLR